MLPVLAQTNRHIYDFTFDKDTDREPANISFIVELVIGGQCQHHRKLNPTLKALGGTAMSVGTVTGETALNLLISSVATTTQALETHFTFDKRLH